jgi:O-methyltransferase involved in polyketide biosynthesis
VADGVFMFLTEQALRRLLSRIVAHFPTGQIALNAATAFQVKLANRHPPVKRAGATLQWSLHDPRALEMFHPTVKLAEERMIIESPWLSHASKAYRTTCAVMKSTPALRAQGGRILRYMF